MELKITQTIERQLTLTEEEAEWLHSLMQNPLWGRPEEEPVADREIRKKFWEATKPV